MKKTTKTETKKQKQVKENSKHLSTLRKSPIKIEENAISYTKEQINKINRFDKKTDKDYETMMKSIESFFEKYNKIVCGIDIRVYRGTWRIKFSFDNERARNQALS